MQVFLKREARNAITRMDRRTRERILRAIEALAADPFAGDVTPIEGGPPGEFRLRVGGWRLLYQVDVEAQAVTVDRVRPRGDVYGR